MSRRAIVPGLPANVHFLRRDWFNSNSVLITGARTVLIDAGSDIAAGGLIELMGEHGVTPEAIDLIVATHGHADHVGAIAELQGRYGTPVAMHEYDAYYVNRDDHWATWRTPHGNRFPAFRVDVALHDGEVLQLDGFSLQVLHTPGHAYGGISLYCPEHRFLVAGDAVWEKAVGVIDVGVEGSIAPFLARESVRRLMALDVALVIPGHGRAIGDARDNFREALAYIEGFLADPQRMGYDLIWRVLYFNLWREGPMAPDELLRQLSDLQFFAGTNKMLFKVSDAELFDRVVNELKARGLICLEEGVLRIVARQR